MNLVLLDDHASRRFEPFSLSRPVSELRAGAELLRRRWEIAFGAAASALVVADHLTDFEEGGAPPVYRGGIAAGTIVATSRCGISLARITPHADVWRCDGRVAAIRLGRETSADALGAVATLDELVPEGAAPADVQGWWIDEVWDLILHLPAMLASDIPLLGNALERQSPSSITRIGDHPVYIERGATVEPFVVVDATLGPVLVRHGTTVAAFTRLVGPCVVGPDTIVNGGRIATSSIGDACRVHGEVSTTILVGHANKAHDGFIGHSILGRWVNLGAATVNSNLKNTYGTVSLWTPDGLRATGLQFLGTLFGDHVKTAVGTRLPTGCVVGTGANVFGSPTAPKVVPPFAWGIEGDAVCDFDRFLRTAERMMARRHVSLGERARRQLRAAYDRRWQASA